jgi:hypothetical protein
MNIPANELPATLDPIIFQSGQVRPNEDGPDGHRKREAVFRLALKKLGRSELKQVQVDLCGDRIQLRGYVNSFHAKQVAQEALRPLAAGLSVDNQVRVVSRTKWLSHSH